MEFKKLSKPELQNIETRLLQKKLKFNVKDGKIKRKAGNKAGKTQYIICETKKQQLFEKKYLTMLEFCKLYNDEMELLGFHGLYTKIARNKMVLNYMFTRGFLKIKKSKRIRLGEEQEYTNYWIKGSYKEIVLDFFTKYLSSTPIDNEPAIRKMIEKNPKSIVNPEKLSEKRDYREKTGLVVKTENVRKNAKNK